MSLNFNKTTVEEILDGRKDKNVGQLIQERCTEYYNEGVEHCIAKAKEYSRYSWESVGSSADMVEEMIKDFEQLKKIKQ